VSEYRVFFNDGRSDLLGVPRNRGTNRTDPAGHRRNGRSPLKNTGYEAIGFVRIGVLENLGL